MPANKLGRKARRTKMDVATSAFVRNKWNGKEPLEDFNAREQKLYNNISANNKKA